MGAADGVVTSDKNQKQLRVTIPPRGRYVLTVRPNRTSIGILYEQIMKEKFVEVSCSNVQYIYCVCMAILYICTVY